MYHQTDQRNGFSLRHLYLGVVALVIAHEMCHFFSLGKCYSKRLCKCDRQGEERVRKTYIR